MGGVRRRAEKIHTADPTVYISSFDPGEFQFFAAQAAQAGAEWWTNDGDTWKVGIDSEESLATADFWQDLVERDLVKVEALVTPEWNAEINDGKGPLLGRSVLGAQRHQRRRPRHGRQVGVRAASPVD